MHRELLIGGIQVWIVTAGSGDRRFGGYQGPPKLAPLRKIPSRGCVPESGLPVADPESLLRRCRNWRPAHKQTAMPATLPPSRCRRRESLPPPSPRTSFPRLCVPGAAPHPGAASADSARKTNCSDIPRDALAGILPTPTARSDDDVVADEWYSNPVVTAVAPLRPARAGSRTAWLPILLRPSPPARANRSRLPPPVPDTRGPCPAHSATACDLTLPQPQLEPQPQDLFDFSHGLSGTLSSFIYGVSMPGDCPASLRLLLFVCGKHSAPSLTPFR